LVLERDVRNMANYFGQFAPEEDAADIDAVMREIKAALADEAHRSASLNPS
jgi:RIO kinase 1